MGFNSRFERKSSTFFLLLALLCSSLSAHAASYLVTILTSDQTGTAPVIDPNLQNPWGLSYSPTGPFWVTDNHSGVSTIYNGTGTASGLVVTIPPAAGHVKGNPTGTVFNQTTEFHVN